MRIYVSGKITGLPMEVAENSFHQAEIELKDKYLCEVVNPMKLVPYESGKTWEGYMIDDIKLLFECDTIYMLDNWEDSKGARVECAIAKEMGKNVIFQSVGIMSLKPKA